MSILSTYRRHEYKKPTMCPTSGKGVSTQAKMGKYINDSRRITMAGVTTEERGSRKGRRKEKDEEKARKIGSRGEIGRGRVKDPRCMWSLRKETHIIYVYSDYNLLVLNIMSKKITLMVILINPVLI